ncbi:hypothetical protein QAD02_003532 [Eretmocerus hayati]|uniref:Uncharacterized protein n=1 Tax=Eretmocerus hayati TaxID=131215 RepID=A0ACC2NN85_9HYME|nr:hypothetical protein QAD02_003532 [Eretmocerus hayati]
MTKDKSDDNSNDRTDNGDGQSRSGETQTQKVDSTLKDEDTSAEQFRAALAEKSLQNIENQTSGIVVNQPNKLGEASSSPVLIGNVRNLNDDLQSLNNSTIPVDYNPILVNNDSQSGLPFNPAAQNLLP